MNYIKRRKPSALTATDEFCGAGGTTTGATQAGLEVKMAMNHWELAIETHNTNYPDVDHDCRDISASDPARYPSTDFLLASPECTNHSLAKGKKRKYNGTGDLFKNEAPKDSEVRSRATMWDVPRFAEYHDYSIIIVENVVDARNWVMWPAWIKAMQLLGYNYKPVYFNSMFAWPTPQSRDRVYIVFWKKGNPAPDLDLRPEGYCVNCSESVAAVQSWKRPERMFGRYGKNGQYVYRCPKCSEEITPFYFAAFNAIDWSIKATRIGDRKKPLKKKTLDRIQYGLEKYGNSAIMITNRYLSGMNCRVKDPLNSPIPTQPGSNCHALVSPGIFQKNYGGVNKGYSFAEPLGSITTVDSHSVISPALIQLGYSNLGIKRVSGAMEPMPTQTPRQTVGVSTPPFIANMYGTSRTSEIGDPLLCVTAGGVNHALISSKAFLTYYYGTMNASSINESIGTVTTVDRANLVCNSDSLKIEDCTFRMLQPLEIQRAMAFPTDYVILGNKRDQVKQLGNAVTPPVMRILCERAIQSLL